LLLFRQCDNWVDADVSQLHTPQVRKHASGNGKRLKTILLNVNISMTVGQIFTKSGNFIENKTDIHAVKL